MNHLKIPSDFSPFVWPQFGDFPLNLVKFLDTDGMGRRCSIQGSCIGCGHLLGAMQGRSAIPDRWLAPLELREVMEEMADDVATAGIWPLGDWDDPEACVEEDYCTERYPGA